MSTVYADTAYAATPRTGDGIVAGAPSVPDRDPAAMDGASLASAASAVITGLRALGPEASAAITHRIPAGWYPVRDDPARRRWWDGIDWTDHYSSATVTSDIPAITSPRHAAAPLAHERIDTGEVAAISRRSAPAAHSAGYRPVPAAIVATLIVLICANAAALSVLALG